MTPTQALLFEDAPRLTRAALSRFLNKENRREVDVTFTRNRVTMASVSFPADGPIPLRLHEGFLDAPQPVLAALSKYLRTRRKAKWAEVCAFARLIPTDPAPPRRRTLQAKGRVHDLAAIGR